MPQYPYSKIRLERYTEERLGYRDVRKEWGIGDFTFLYQTTCDYLQVFQNGQLYATLPITERTHVGLRKTIKRYVFEKLLAGREYLV